ncbi:MAG: MBL fold metallo-hydrolase [Bacteroidota bacterium]
MMQVTQIRSTDGTGTLSYIIQDPATAVAVIIDPNKEDIPALEGLLIQTGARLTHIIDTHTHVDHVSGANPLREKFGAIVVMHENTKNKWKIIDQGDKFGIGDTLRANAAITVDQYTRGEETITTGPLELRMLFTPGHTDNHIAVLVGDALFTGDLLLIGQAGRSDLPGGDPGQQYDSLFTTILPLPDSIKMYPGHDYEGNEFSYLRDEKRNNPFLQKRTKPEYIEFVKNFFPPIAEEAVRGGKMTLQCGTQRVMQPSDKVRNVTPSQLAELLTKAAKPHVLDVREPFELTSFGAIEGVQNIPVGQLVMRRGDLPADKAVEIVCVCQSGGRSLEAAHVLQSNGYTNVLNLVGGTVGWVKAGYKVIKDSVHA